VTRMASQSYNPSLLRFQNKLLLVSRAHDRKDWRTRLYLSELSDDLKQSSESKLIEMPAEYAEHSHEDARLFIFRRELWMSWTIGRPSGNVHRCVLAMSRLLLDRCAVGNVIIPRQGANDFSAMEKNWLAFEHENELWCYYSTSERTQTFVRLNGAQVAERVESESLPWNYGPIHGGAITRWKDDRLLFFFNSRTGGDRQLHRYHIGCAELEGKPPFKMLRISTKPILYGQEGCNLTRNKFFKPNVVFACGAMAEGDRVLLAFGWNDSESRIAKLKESDLRL